MDATDETMEICDCFWCGVLEFVWWLVFCLFFDNNAGSLELMMLIAPLIFDMGPWCLSEPRVGFYVLCGFGVFQFISHSFRENFTLPI